MISEKALRKIAESDKFTDRERVEAFLQLEPKAIASRIANEVGIPHECVMKVFSELRKSDPRPMTVYRCKVCKEQMREYDHGYLGCDCKGWGSDVETDKELGMFDEARHELIEVIPKDSPNVLSDEEAQEVARYLEGSGREDIQALWLRLKKVESN